jgi:hypothetical protein
VAIPAGFELATHGVEIRYPIQLSYGAVWAVGGPRCGATVKCEPMVESMAKPLNLKSFPISVDRPG